jgi:hypothetical protein
LPELARASVDEFVSALTALVVATNATGEIGMTGFESWHS